MNTRQVIVGLILLVLSSKGSGQGLALNGIGPVNQAMGGASVAAPIDAVGALHWNPASISGLAKPEAAFGVTLALPSERLNSRVTFPVSASGSTRAKPGVSPIPYGGFVDRRLGSRLTYGLGVFGVGGFRTNYAAGDSNPILTAPPNGSGLGRLFADAQLLQVVPTAAWACSESMSIGIAPTISLARIDASPMLLAAPDDANGDGFFTYPDGGGSRYHWGGGFQLGWYFIANNAWHFGASFKSEQWFEEFEFQSQTELGTPRDVRLQLEYPTIVSLGTAYSGIEHILIASDVRYFDYENAKGLGTRGFRADGASAGLGWESIMALAVGLQLELTDSCQAQIGYTFNENPISNSQASANIASPVITQHLINVGISVHLSDSWDLSTAYTHGFENEIAGPIETAAGTIPGSQVKSIVSLNGLTFGIRIRH